MSSVMQVYLADLAALKAAVGSSDTALFDAITVTWPSDNEAKDSLSDREALQVLIDGGPFERTQQGRYFAALEAICARIGEHIDDFTFHHGDLDELDDEFDVPEGLSIESFLYAWFDEFPSLDGERAGGGYWTKEKCARALSLWESDDPDDFAELNESTLEDLDGAELWLIASKRSGRDVVTFW